MNDLPRQGNTNDVSQMPSGASVGAGMAKESEAIPSSELPLRETGTEVELQNNVEAIGVRVKPTVVKLPPAVAKMGVKPAGTGTPLGTGTAVTLPLTQPQITQGLTQSITDSWRWLAVWCIRRLKQIRYSLISYD